MRKIMRRQKHLKYNRWFTVLVFGLLLGGLPPLLSAQTCSCAGAPIANPLEYQDTASDKKWHFELSFKYHAINDLVQGSEKVTNDTDRRRSAQALFLETRYKLSHHITLISHFNFTGHSRNVGISSAGTTTTNGIGDSMLSVQYTPLRFSPDRRFELSIGGGLKMPTGKSEAQTLGLAPEDMQPGTGSWDAVAWLYVAAKLPAVQGLQLFGGAAVRFNGENDRDYRFGSDIIATAGAKKLTRGLLDYSLYLKYRRVESDQRFGGDIPNTGGQWLYLVPAVTIKAAKNFGFKTQVELPLYRKLNGALQFTTTLAVSASVWYEI